MNRSTDNAIELTVIAERLRAAGCVFAEDEAEILISAASGSSELESMLARRSMGEPIQHVVGWAEFCGRKIGVTPNVFVPRSRSELLAREAIRLCENIERPVVVELCCGAAAVAVTLALEHQGAEVYASDIDPLAVECATRNLAGIGTVLEGDLYAALKPEIAGRVDLLIANAPYVPTAEIALMPAEARDHERFESLDGGEDGLDVQRRVISSAPSWLKPGGYLLIETSAVQSEATLALFAGAGLTARLTSTDEFDANVAVGTLSA